MPEFKASVIYKSKSRNGSGIFLSKTIRELKANFPDLSVTCIDPKEPQRGVSYV